MAVSRVAALAVAAPLACVLAACTFGGLGNYDVETCARPTGTSTTVQKVGSVNDLTFASASGKNVIGAFVTGGSCIEAVGAAGFLNPTCSFLTKPQDMNLVPRQPVVVPISGGYAAAFVATTAPCTVGQLTYRFSAPSIAGGGSQNCDPATGAALPSVATFSDSATSAIAWYSTSFDSRSDPISSCAGAKASPLSVAIVTAAATGAPVLGDAMMLSASSISVRPPAVIPVGAQAVVAAPHLNDVGVWTVNAQGSPGAPLTIPGLAGARAVALATASDGSGHLAVVAEIGCTPQSIALSIGTLADGFPTATVVAPAGSSVAVAPSVAWIDGQNRWVVAWISAAGGAHVLTRSFDATGHPLGSEVDLKLAATAASVASTGDVVGFVASTNSFVDTSLGCTP